jgi:hypothetical protein
MMCDFIENPVIQTAVVQAVPVTMPRLPGALGFDIPLWVGLGLVGLWAALDGFSERANLQRHKCMTCGTRCVPVRFAAQCLDSDCQSLAELEDLRHLYAHNYAGEADNGYFARNRHVLKRDVSMDLTCGARFDGRRPWLDLPHLRNYSQTAQRVLGRFG